MDENHCSNPDRLLFEGSGIRVGAFRCPVHHPQFRTAGPIEGYTIVFPRSAVWICPEGRRPFVADPAVVPLYNLGQPYVRAPLSAGGDRCDWFSMDRTFAQTIAAEILPEATAASTELFPMAFARSSPQLYYRQRCLFTRIAARTIDRFEVEQEVTLLVGAALQNAAGLPGHRSGARTKRARVVVEDARAALARDPSARITVHELAAQVGASPFYLCRAFRRTTGTTMHRYLLALRLRAGLEQMETPGPGLRLVALALGFASHSHFTSAFRAEFGFPPSRARTQLKYLQGLGRECTRVPLTHRRACGRDELTPLRAIG
jgi:AraC-like DNA-binding protein